MNGEVEGSDSERMPKQMNLHARCQKTPWGSQKHEHNAGQLDYHVARTPQTKINTPKKKTRE